jgi:hypothetical protein
MKPLDLAGQRFGRFVVLSRGQTNSKQNFQWKCQCDCGKLKMVAGDGLRSGKTKSCGCLRREILTHGPISLITHGHWRGGSPTPEYKTWETMKYRCSNPKFRGWKYYGGRGIRVCRRWLKFENFLTDMGPRPPGQIGKRAKFTIERRDNDGHYTPKNCYWATMKQQAANRRNLWITRRLKKA